MHRVRAHKEDGGFLKRNTCLVCGFVDFNGRQDDVLAHVFNYHGERAAEEWKHFDWTTWDPKTFTPTEPLPCPQSSGTVRGNNKTFYLLFMI